MNDHVSKPFEPEGLFNMLLRWLPLPKDALAHTGPAASGAGLPANTQPLMARLAGLPGLDPGLALRQLAGQEALLARVLACFVSTYRAGEPALLEPPTPDGQQHWQAAAHSLRGAAATVGAVDLQQQLEAFEQALARGGSSAALAATAAGLHEATIGLARRLQALLDGR